MENLPSVVIDKKTSNSQYITFSLGNEFFGIDLHSIEEIVLPQRVTKVPQTPKYFLGILNLRGEIVSVIDLRLRFGLQPKEIDEYSRVIIIVSKGIKIGLLVDQIKNIATFPFKDVKTTLPLVGEKQQNYLYGSVKLSDGTVLLLLICDAIIAENDFKVHRQISPLFQNSAIEQEQEIVKVKDIHMVGFSIGNEFFAIPGERVEEIIEYPQLTPLPEENTFVKGIFYLRNSAIPAIDMSERLGFKNLTSSETNPTVIIVSFGKYKVGLIVEKISEVFHIKENEVLPPPANISATQVEQLKGIIKLSRGEGRRLVMFLDLENTLSKDEKGFLEQISEANRDEEGEASQLEQIEEIILLFFELHNELFAIPVLETNEIISPPVVVPIPKAPPYIKGVINVRGDVMPVINLPKLTHEQDIEFNEDTKFVIIQLKNEIAAIIVEKLLGIKKFRKTEIETNSSEIVKQKGNLFIKDIIKNEDGKIIMLMDLEKTLEQAKQNNLFETALISDESNTTSLKENSATEEPVSEEPLTANVNEEAEVSAVEKEKPESNEEPSEEVEPQTNERYDFGTEKAEDREKHEPEAYDSPIETVDTSDTQEEMLEKEDDNILGIIDIPPEPE